ncbi:dodecin domain-containing protein [Verticiella sediminum]|uniref:Dodecin domain-containing protein n=1 Tax=Verticiella sediminum TaxID=1247510 RepID=A0A556ATS1_9BURK|nr:dodecin [Verticiella sediminum]TSH95785.1 dodecin domain-containing protein [Verticiella sediminum]
MTEHVYKKIELVGSSPVSSDDAIKNALDRASETLKHLDWFEVTEVRGHLTGGKIAHWQVGVKVGMRVDRAED